MSDLAKLPFSGGRGGVGVEGVQNDILENDQQQEEEEEEEERNDIDGFCDISAEVLTCGLGDDAFFLEGRGVGETDTDGGRGGGKGGDTPLEGQEDSHKQHSNSQKHLRHQQQGTGGGGGGGELSELTEQRIDEVIGSFNLADLKKFRVELIKYVSVCVMSFSSYARLHVHVFILCLVVGI